MKAAQKKCKAKKQFNTPNEAWASLKTVQSKTGNLMNHSIYLCRFCKKYHIGSRVDHFYFIMGKLNSLADS